jgi:hypothetical protein
VLNNPIVITEKLDGENTWLNEWGVFSRSHAAPSFDPWSNFLWERWEINKDKFKGLEVFGENLYAVHAINYSGLNDHFYVFAIREGDFWFSWDEVEFYADVLELQTVPVLFTGTINDLVLLSTHGQATEILPNKVLENYILQCVSENSFLCDPSLYASPREGLVVRIAEGFPNSEFYSSVFKWVRPHHVQSEEHWRRNWRRAMLHWELERMIRKW